MNNDADKSYLKLGLTLFLALSGVALAVFVIFFGKNIKEGILSIISIFMPILNGLGIAYIITPLARTVENKIVCPLYKKMLKELKFKHTKQIRGISVFATMIVVGLALYLFFSLAIPEIINSIRNIAIQLPTYANNLINWVEGLLAKNPDMEKVVVGWIETYYGDLQNILSLKVLPQLDKVWGMVSTGVSSVLQWVWNLIIGLIISVYVMFAREKFAGQAKKIVYALLNTKSANELVNNVRFIHRTFITFLSGNILDSLIIGILCFISISIMKMPYAALISIIVGVTNIIPFFGPWLGAIPSALLILVVNPAQALYFCIFILVLQQFDGNVLKPKILGESMGLSGFWIIASVMVFGGLFKVFGMFIGVPLFAVIYAAVRAFCNEKLRSRGLPADTPLYEHVAYIQGSKFVDVRAEHSGTKDEKLTKKKRSAIENDYDGSTWQERDK